MKAAMIQLAVKDNDTKRDRMHKVKGILKDMSAAEDKPRLILLPEIWGTGFFNFEHYKDESEPVEGETYSELAPWAEEMGCYLLTGSFVERDGGDYYNTSLLIGPGGNIITKYRKIHLFGYRSDESRLLSPGDAVVVADTEIGTLGISTCYDLRFPELYRKMLDKGVEILLVVAAWPAARLEHWNIFNRARALENQCFLVSCNCSGYLKGIKFGGNSMIVDPWGVQTASGGEEDTVVYGDIDISALRKNRAEFPAVADRVLVD